MYLDNPCEFLCLDGVLGPSNGALHLHVVRLGGLQGMLFFERRRGTSGT